jgi:hypothetical protein
VAAGATPGRGTQLRSAESFDHAVRAKNRICLWEGRSALRNPAASIKLRPTCGHSCSNDVAPGKCVHEVVDIRLGVRRGNNAATDRVFHNRPVPA